MRLLHRVANERYQLSKNFREDEVPPYAILSHTWGRDEDEVTFEDLEANQGREKAGYRKIIFCGEQAAKDGLDFFWVDTCCIKKTSDAELSESINSMFRWYKRAAKCYVYLVDVLAIESTDPGSQTQDNAFCNSRWHTRCWTLQELLAPPSVEFFSVDGQLLGDKKSLERHIHRSTGIPTAALQGHDLSAFSVEERMSWTGQRKASKPEDKAYCLLGIFGIFMPLIYGEGEHATVRLRKEVERFTRGKEALLQCQKLLRVTNPRHDKKRIEATKGGLLEQSYRWVLENQDFHQWQTDPRNPLLWIRGDPGKGKTMLLCGIIDELQKQHVGNIAYFFFQASDRRINSATAVIRSLLFMLIEQQPPLVSYIQQRYDQEGEALFTDVNAWTALSDILSQMIRDPMLQSTYFIIDALDECVSGLSELLNLMVELLGASPQIKWLISSRNWPHIEEGLYNAEYKIALRLELNEESVAAAVTTYIQAKVEDLAKRKRYDDGMRSTVQQHLLSNAQGTFLWVALVCQALVPIARHHTISALRTFPSGLDPFYRQMMDQLDPMDADLCRRILAIVSVAYEPITLDELLSLIDFQSCESLTEIIQLCGSFLTVRNRTIFFIHQSAQDFLLTKGSAEIFPAGQSDIHLTIYRRSLDILSEILRRDMYGVGAPGVSIDEIDEPNPNPLIASRYQCIYWVDHLHESSLGLNVGDSEDVFDGKIIDTFLQKKYLYWLEALSHVRSVPQGIISMSKLCTIVQNNERSRRLANLVYDALRFMQYYGSIIAKYPLQVYASGLVFSPQKSVIRDLFRPEFPSWIVTQPATEETWNACLQTLEGHRDFVTSVAFSPDSKLVASGSKDGTLKIWAAATGALQKTFKDSISWGEVESIVFSPDSKLVASSSDHNVNIWAIATGAPQQTFRNDFYLGGLIVFSPDSKLLAMGAYNSVEIWAVETGALRQRLEGRSWLIAFSPNSKLFATTSYKYDEIWGVKSWGVEIRAVDTGALQQRLECHRPWSIAFSPNSKLLATASHRVTEIWDAATGVLQQTLEEPTLSPKPYQRGSQELQEVKTMFLKARSLAFSPDLKLVASASDSTVNIWDTATGTLQQTLEGSGKRASTIVFSSNSKLIALISDETIKIWATATGKLQHTLEGVRSVAFSPDLTLGASASDRAVKIWTTTMGELQKTFTGHSGRVDLIVVSADLTLVASSSAKTVNIWATTTGALQATLKGHRYLVSSVTFSPDSKLIASVSGETVKIWTTTTGALRGTLEGHTDDWVYSVAFSPNSRLIASVSGKTVMIWTTTTGALQGTLKGHTDWVYSVAFSPDSTLVASNARDGTVRIWAAEAGTLTQTLYIGVASSILAFDYQSNSILTDDGAYEVSVPLQQASATNTMPASIPPITRWGIRSDGCWITLCGTKVLWIPKDYRPTALQICEQIIAVGCDNGRVWIAHLENMDSLQDMLLCGT